jgi:hypothetical protein
MMLIALVVGTVLFCLVGLLMVVAQGQRGDLRQAMWPRTGPYCRQGEPLSDLVEIASSKRA